MTPKCPACVDPSVLTLSPEERAQPREGPLGNIVVDDLLKVLFPDGVLVADPVATAAKALGIQPLEEVDAEGEWDQDLPQEDQTVEIVNISLAPEAPRSSEGESAGPVKAETKTKTKVKAKNKPAPRKRTVRLSNRPLKPSSGSGSPSGGSPGPQSPSNGPSGPLLTSGSGEGSGPGSGGPASHQFQEQPPAPSTLKPHHLQYNWRYAGTYQFKSTRDELGLNEEFNNLPKDEQARIFHEICTTPMPFRPLPPHMQL
ncbi:hypothetical protein QBC38DRAFT_489407 [Podospora fimiseda]|uniref:Uncharacterized protein n=1 Tax=Podospora fimiseda TaxID=252190 RepID=A0AAN7BG87_9PEZI|nr:hypothetical protein QBC38DRAFT_489407 [Podospora fimiseda]